MWQRSTSRRAALAVAASVFLGCCVLPVGYLVATSLSVGSAGYSALLLDARQRALLSNTAVLGAGTALLATAIGMPLGLALARVPLPWKGSLRLALAAPALLPPYIVALAWTYVLPPWIYSLPAAVLVLSLVFYPLSMLATEIALRRIDGRLEEAALTVAAPGRVLRRITLPLAAPTVAAAALVVFVLAVSEFGVPGLLRVRVYTTEVFTAFAALYDFSRAIALSIPLLILCIVVSGAAVALVGDRLVTTRRPTRAQPLSFLAWRRTFGVAIAVVIGLLASTLVILTSTAVHVRAADAVLAGAGQAIVNSLTLAAVGAIVVTAVALCLGYARARTARVAVGRAADVLSVVLFAVPSTIVGVGLIALWNRPGLPADVYGTDVMFLLAYLARFLPVATLILAASARYVPVSHEEAAAVSGAGWARTMWRIVVPQMRLGLAAALVVVFVLAFGELGASILIAPPGETTLPIRIYTIIANTPPAHVAALALLQTLVVLAPLAAIAGARIRRSRAGARAAS